MPASAPRLDIRYPVISPANNTSQQQAQANFDYSNTNCSRSSTPTPTPSPTDTDRSVFTPPLRPSELYFDDSPSCTPTQASYLVGRSLPFDKGTEVEVEGILNTASKEMSGIGSSSLATGNGSGSSSGGTRRASIRRGGAGSDSIVMDSGAAVAGRRVSDDDGLIMRDRSERDGEGSIGRAGGVDVGVTRPKRRLSRALSTSSPPFGINTVNSTFQSLANGGMPSQPYGAGNPGFIFPRSSEKTEERESLRYIPARASGKDVKVDNGSPRLFGIELKWISLLTLALQNAFLTIIMHYSRISVSPNKTYSAASAVLLNELLKGSISVIIALRNIDKSMSTSASQQPPALNHRTSYSVLISRFSLFFPSRLSALRQAVFSRDCIKLSIPAILYVIQNNLQYTAASNLDVATFQVTYQMKILTTAAFSVVMLRKRLSRVKWLSLVLLAIGVGIVQIQSTTGGGGGSHTQTKVGKATHALRSDIPEVDVERATEKVITALNSMSPLKGFMAVTAACVTSGLAGVYFELLLKSGSSTPSPSGSSGSTSGAGSSSNTQPDLWVRNTQLSLFSLVPAIVPILFNGTNDGLGPIGRLMAAFSNFNGWAIGTVLTQTFGGLVTAIVIRYSDNIMKGFATSLSIIISFLASVALFSYPITFAFVLGSSVVLCATFMYNAPTSSSAPMTARRDMAIPPGSPILTSAPILGEPEKPSRASSVISLLGLAGSGGSRAPSRVSSGENLRHMASLSGLTPHHSTHSSYSSAASVGSSGAHGYAASAPGTPYAAATLAVSTNGYGNASSSSLSSNPYDQNPTGGRISPNLTPLPPRLRTPLPPTNGSTGDAAAAAASAAVGGRRYGNGNAGRKGSFSGESDDNSSVGSSGSGVLRIGGNGGGALGMSVSGSAKSPPRLKVDMRRMD